MIIYPSDDVAVVDRPGADVNGARDITVELNAIFASNHTALLKGGPNGASGYYKIDVDSITTTAAMGARSLIGAGGRTQRTIIAMNGAGTGLEFQAENCLVSGIHFVDAAGATNKNQTAIKFTTNRYHVAQDIRGYAIENLIHLHGESVYYWHIEQCLVQDCTNGFKFTATDNDATKGPNRGTLLNCVASACTIGYNIVKGDTIEFLSCKTANCGTGLYVGGRWTKWLGGSFEGDTSNAFEVETSIQDTTITGFTIADADSFTDNGTRTTLQPVANRAWKTQGVT